MMKLITPLAVIAVCIGMYFLYISPTAMKINALSKQKAEYNTVLEKAKELTAKRDELATSYNSISEDDIARLSKIVPQKFDPVVMANDLSTIATQNRLAFTEFKSAVVNDTDRQIAVDPQNAAPYKTTQISFKVVGQYSDFLKFLNNAEQNLRLLDVTNLEIIPDTGNEKASNNAMQYVLTINTYSLQ